MSSFPVDELTLGAVEHALGGAYTVDPDSTHRLVGADFTLDALLDFLAGIDHSEDEKVMERIDSCVFYDPRPHFHPNDVIRALIAEVRRLRSLLPQED